MAWPTEVDNLDADISPSPTTKTLAELDHSGRHNRPAQALRALRTKLGALGSVPDDLLDQVPDDSLLVKQGGQWQELPSGTFVGTDQVVVVDLLKDPSDTSAKEMWERARDKVVPGGTVISLAGTHEFDIANEGGITWDKPQVEIFARGTTWETVTASTSTTNMFINISAAFVSITGLTINGDVGGTVGALRGLHSTGDFTHFADVEVSNVRWAGVRCEGDHSVVERADIHDISERDGIKMFGQFGRVSHVRTRDCARWDIVVAHTSVDHMIEIEHADCGGDIDIEDTQWVRISHTTANQILFSRTNRMELDRVTASYVYSIGDVEKESVTCRNVKVSRSTGNNCMVLGKFRHIRLEAVELEQTKASPESGDGNLGVLDLNASQGWPSDVTVEVVDCTFDSGNALGHAIQHPQVDVLATGSVFKGYTDTISDTPALFDTLNCQDDTGSKVDSIRRDDVVHMPLDDSWRIILGAPTFTDEQRWVGWSFRGSDLDSIAKGAWVPDSWTTFTVDIWWENEGTGTGDVRWSIRYAGVDEGETITGTPASMGTNVQVDKAAGGQNEVVKSTTPEITAEAGLENIHLARRGDFGSEDTLSDAATAFALTLRKAS